MDRRTVLRTAGVALAAGSLPLARATDEPFTPRSHLPLQGTKEAVVGADGTTVYVAVTDGFATVDVSDPDDPRVLAERRGLLADRDGGPIERIHDAKVDGDVLAVAGPANGLGFGGVLLYDVSDPAAPRRLAFHETPWPVHNCDVSDGVVYLTANNAGDNPVVMVEWDGDETREVGRWSLFDVDESAWSGVHLGARSIHDVAVDDGVACCAYWDAGTWLLDVADPSAPAVLGTAGGRPPEELAALSSAEKGFATIEPPGNAHYAELSDDGSVLAVGKESWDGRRGDGHGGPSGIDLWDVSDPADASHLSTVEPFVPRDATRNGAWTTAHNFELAGGRLYSSWYHDGVKLHDVSDPTRPELLGHWRAPEETRFWTARLGRPGEFFVAADMGTRNSDTDDAGLYLFPDRPGTQPDQPAIPTPTATPTAADSPSPSSATASSPTSSTAPSSTSPTTPAPSSSTPRTGTADGSPGSRTTDPGRPTSQNTASDPSPGAGDPGQSVRTPGFGVPAAAVGVGVAAWRLVWRGD